MPESKRFLGLELSGAKNQKTSLAVLEYYPKEKKTFLLDVFDKVATHEDQTSDEALIELIEEESQRDQPQILAVNVPLTLPPCITCSSKTCPAGKKCSSPSVLWIQQYLKKLGHKKNHFPRVNPVTPYTQRPIEVWVRYQVFSELPKTHQFDIDETLGGNKAPLTARMHYLKKHLKKVTCIETWPKLTISSMSKSLGLQPRVIHSYRLLEQGAHFREEILIQIAKEFEIFIYERDLRKLSTSLTAFDAFICAFTALLWDRSECVKVPKGFPEKSGWVYYPRV